MMCYFQHKRFKLVSKLHTDPRLNILFIKIEDKTISTDYVPINLQSSIDPSRLGSCFPNAHVDPVCIKNRHQCSNR